MGPLSGELLPQTYSLKAPYALVIFAILGAIGAETLLITRTAEMEKPPEE